MEDTTHINKPLGIIEVLFAFKGRIGRLAFIGYNLLAGFTLLALSLATAAMIVQQASLWMISLCLSAPWILACWIGAALLAKRLHDIDRSALHGIWITALWYLSPWLPDPLLMALALVGIIVGLTLMLLRGSGGPNRYGHKAGMAMVGDLEVSPTTA